MSPTVIDTRCPFCLSSEEIVVPNAAYDAWRGGAFIQTVFPDMPKERREQLISGTCPSCWETEFGGEE